MRKSKPGSEKRHPHGRTWHRRWRHSLRLRLVTMFVLLALAMTAVFMGGMRGVFASGWREAAKPLIADYVDRLTAEIGSPPEVARAQALTQRLATEFEGLIAAAPTQWHVLSPYFRSGAGR